MTTCLVLICEDIRSAYMAEDVWTEKMGSRGSLCQVALWTKWVCDILIFELPARESRHDHILVLTNKITILSFCNWQKSSKVMVFEIKYLSSTENEVHFLAVKCNFSNTNCNREIYFNCKRIIHFQTHTNL